MKYGRVPVSSSALMRASESGSKGLSGKEWIQGAAMASNGASLTASAPVAIEPVHPLAVPQQTIVPCPAHPEGHPVPAQSQSQGQMVDESQNRAMLAVGWAVVICTLYAWYRRKEAGVKKRAGEKQVMIPMQPMENHNVVLIIARRDTPEKKPKPTFSKTKIPGTSLTLSRLNPSHWFAE